MADFENILLELTPPIARLVINRPGKLNALNAATLNDLEAALEQLRDEAGLRAIVLTGAGEKAFVAGADIEELAALDPLAAAAMSRRGNDLFARIADFPVPIIAAINGFALGGGLELALACSIRLAAESARMGQPEVKLGLIPGYGGTQRLARLVGTGRALEMILTGDPITAPEALRIGLVNAVVPAAELAAAAEKLARRIAANGAVAVRLAQQAVRQGTEMGLESALALESSLFALACTSADMKEGTRAFLEKRPPRFTGQ